ncbi:MAG: amidohydrolase family protein [Bauldia sp.]
MPNFPIVDAHVHIYDPAALPYHWLKNAPAINKAHLPADYTRLTAPVVVEKYVFAEVDVEVGRHVDEANWVAEQAKADKRIAGIVASVPLERGKAVEADLAVLAKMPLVKSIRRLMQHFVDQPGWCLQPGFVEGMKLLPKYGLSFDLCILHPQMADTIELVRRCPEVSFILDHIGKPGIKANLREPWWSQMKELASLPNVICKVSGVVTEDDHKAWTYDRVAPYVARSIECFGFDRVAFGGDWPVLELASTYPRWVEVVDRVTAGSSEADLRNLYRDNAIRFYRL